MSTLPAFPAELAAPETLAGAGADPERLGWLDDVLDRAEADGVLDEAAVDPELARAGRANALRHPVAAKRLWLLGYLDFRPRRDERLADARLERFLAALARFQVDAGLRADG